MSLSSTIYKKIGDQSSISLLACMGILFITHDYMIYYQVLVYVLNLKGQTDRLKNNVGLLIRIERTS